MHIAPKRDIEKSVSLFLMQEKGCIILKKTLIVTMLIITLCTSLFLFLHIRNTPKANINTSSLQALEALPGIGNVLAVRIIQDRPYMDVYELDRVKGIGPKTIEKIINKVVVK